MMKKILTYAVSALALASCSSDSLVSDSPANTQAPIAFNVGQKNITRTEKQLEAAGYTSFGVWAYKYKAGDKAPALVMGNYQVGCAGCDGFKNDKVETGKWFYEGLGSSEKKQVLRYWDLSYDNTKFFAYAPYASDTKVECDQNNKKLTVPASVNSDENNIDFIYAGAVMSNATHVDVPLQFKHLRAKVILKFYEDIPGYTVKLIDVKEPKDATDKTGRGIQLTPATFDDTEDPKYSPADYYTAYDAVIDFSKMSNITVKDIDDDAESTAKTKNNLIFELPDGSKVVPEVAKKPEDQNYLVPATYYAVAQPSTSKTGFTLHVSYELTAEDNSETITVRDARVYIPARDKDNKNIAVWQANTQYTYTFKITTDTNGSTSSAEPTITDPDVPTDKGLHPIVFEDVTIVDYETNDTEY